LRQPIADEQMTILVTGGAGYIGSHMVHELADAGESVVVLDDLSTGFRSALPATVPLFVGDAGDFALVSSIIGEHRVEAIIHFAGSIVVPDSLRDPLGYYRNNTMNSRTLLEAAVKGGVRHFIFSSTAAVYGNPDILPVSEDAPTKPLSPYGTSKLMTEIMLHDVAAAHDLKYAILRYFNVAGADPKLRTGQSTRAATHLIKVAVETALGMRPRLDVYGTDYPTPDGTCIRDYIHVSDLARAHSAALAHLRQDGASITCNCGYGRGYSVLEVIEAVKRAAGRNFAVHRTERRPGDPASLVADVRRIHAVLKWSPRYDDLDVIAAHALAWERRLQETRKDVPNHAIPV
jgi:UDP-glucose 4-epimerase